MEKSIMVTVYITNYNYGKYIRQAIESVLNQSFQNFEIIIIDDGSTDNSKEIIEQYASNKKIKIIFQKNKGLNVTNNIALRVAQGKYIMRLDADDYLDSNALLVMVNLLEKDDELGLVFPDYYLVDENGEITNIEKRHNFDKEVTLFDQPAHGACTMIRKKFLQRFGGYDEQYKCQDGYELWVKFTKKFRVSNIDTPLFYYRKHGSNLTSNEHKILSTREKIKDNYVNGSLSKDLNNIVIIPIRGSKYKANDLALMKLGDKTVIDRLIEESCKANKITKVVISSPSEDIEQYIKHNYPTDSKLVFHKRDEALARFNTPLFKTIEEILEIGIIQEINPSYIVQLSIEYPLIKSTTIDDIINSMVIFETDSMISVREETNTFFQHDGTGMKPILNQEKFTRLEREALYKHAGGIAAVSVESFKKAKSVITGKVGHIVIDQKSSYAIRTQLDREIAEFLVDR